MLDNDVLGLGLISDFLDMPEEKQNEIKGNIFDSKYAQSIPEDEREYARQRFLEDHKFVGKTGVDADAAQLYADQKFVNAPREEKEKVLRSLYSKKNAGVQYRDPEMQKLKENLFVEQNMLLAQDKPQGVGGFVDMTKDAISNLPQSVKTSFKQALRQITGGSGQEWTQDFFLDDPSILEDVVSATDEEREEMSRKAQADRTRGMMSLNPSDDVNKNIKYKQLQDAIFEAKYGDYKHEWFDPTGAQASSGATASSMLVGALGALARGASWITNIASNTGMGAASKDDFLYQQLQKANEICKAKNNRPLTPEEIDEITRDLNDMGNANGLIEAISEIVPDAILGKMGGSIAKGKYSQAFTEFVLDLVGENAGETFAGFTQSGQEALAGRYLQKKYGLTDEEAKKAGLSLKGQTVGEAFDEQKGTTMAMLGASNASTVAAAGLRRLVKKPALELDAIKPDGGGGDDGGITEADTNNGTTPPPAGQQSQQEQKPEEEVVELTPEQQFDDAYDKQAAEEQAQAQAEQKPDDSTEGPRNILDFGDEEDTGGTPPTPQQGATRDPVTGEVDMMAPTPEAQPQPEPEVVELTPEQQYEAGWQEGQQQEQQPQVAPQPQAEEQTVEGTDDNGEAEIWDWATRFASAGYEVEKQPNGQEALVLRDENGNIVDSRNVAPAVMDAFRRITTDEAPTPEQPVPQAEPMPQPQATELPQEQPQVPPVEQMPGPGLNQLPPVQPESAQMPPAPVEQLPQQEQQPVAEPVVPQPEAVVPQVEEEPRPVEGEQQPVEGEQPQATQEEKPEASQNTPEATHGEETSKPGATAEETKKQPENEPEAVENGNTYTGKSVKATVSEQKHSKTGEPLFVAKLDERVDADTYKAIKEQAKEHGGYWSKFVGGFIFKDRDSADAFTAAISGKVEEQTEAEAEQKEDYGTIDEPNVPALARHFQKQFQNGRTYPRIGDAREEFFKLLGLPKSEWRRAEQNQGKLIDEVVELGMVMEARRIAEEEKDPVETYRKLVDLYNRQPNLATRTQDSSSRQAYSTPAPIAYLASRLAGVKKDSVVYEPTAGNGALLIEANPSKAVVNELDHGRAERLRSQGFEVTEEDATTHSPKEKVDVVIANPPFGSVRTENGKQKWTGNNFETEKIDQAIMLQALNALKKGGRAVFIVGGKKESDPRERMKAYRGEAGFYQRLFSEYNLVDHFSVSGDLYRRQGASFPIDILVFDGHNPTQNPVYPGGKEIKRYNSFEELEEKLNEISSGSGGQRPVSVSADGQPGDQGSGGTSGRSGVRAGESSAEGGEGQNRAAEAPEQMGERPVSSGDVRANGEQPDRSPVQSTGESGVESPVRRPGVPNEAEASGEERPGTGVAQPDGRTDTESGGLLLTPQEEIEHAEQQKSDFPESKEAKEAMPKPKETKAQSPYEPQSKAKPMGTLVPKNMRDPVKKALEKVAKKHGGDIDSYVARELGYKSKDELHKYFGAEQIDALALAIDNVSNGKGFIIGDQTGIGKGRVNAAMVLWGIRHGKTPVFLSKQSNLFNDIMRDFADIGQKDVIKPFVVNSMTGKDAIELPEAYWPEVSDEDIKKQKLKEKDLVTITDKDGSVHKKKRTFLSSPDNRNAHIAEMEKTGKLPEGYNVVFMTYSQVSHTSTGKNVLNPLKKNAMLVMDEAHSAGSADSAGGKWFREYTSTMSGGVFYSSATFAKRPDILSLYNKTDLSLVGKNPQDLELTLQAGGLPLQQVLAAALTENGQYLRREKSYEGATMETKEVEVSTKTADHISSSLDSIMDFSRTMADSKVDENLADIIAAHGGTAAAIASGKESSANLITFGSLLHNLVSQSTLALKINAVVDEVEKAVRRGEKPVITLSNTMGSFIDGYIAENGIKEGERVDLNFGDMFMNYLDKCRTVHIKRNANDKKGYDFVIPLEDLPDVCRDAYRKAEKLCKSDQFKSLPVSPIDAVLSQLRERGIDCDEITGRSCMLEYRDGVAYYKGRRKASAAEKVRVANAFNAGKVEAIVVNRSGSTGISLHASEKFVDQKPRTMMIVQPELNIDEFMQMLGRVFRTGQVHPPKYQFVISNMPSEKRPAAVLGKKLASLNANTTADAKGSQKFDNIPDFLNVYGDQAALDVLVEDKNLQKRLGLALKETVSAEDKAGLVAKLTGRIPLLNQKEQALVYNKLEEAYNNIVETATAEGTNILDMEARPLDAIPKKSAKFTDAGAQESGFTSESRVYEVDIKVVGKPYTSKQVEQHIAEGQKNAVPAEQIRKDADKYLAGRDKSRDQEQVQQEIDKVNEQVNQIENCLYGFPVGSTVRVTSATAGTSIGVVVGYSRNKVEAGDNPVAPSKWKVVIDVAESKRRITLPLSKVVAANGLNTGSTDGGKVILQPTTGFGRDAVLKMFDNNQTAKREKRAIIMGNIINGFTELLKQDRMGEIITFDMHDGTRAMGILMPQNVTAADIVSAADIELNREQATEFAITRTNPVRLETQDKNIAIIYDGGRYGDYHVEIPANQEDRLPREREVAIAKFVYGEFRKRQGGGANKKTNVFRGYVLKENIPSLIDQIYAWNETLSTKTDKEDALRIKGGGAGVFEDVTSSRSDVMASVRVSSLEGKGGSKGVGMKAGDVRVFCDEVAGEAKGAAPVVVVQSFDELPAHYQEAFLRKGAKPESVEGFYATEEGVVYLVADNLTEDRLAPVWMHEQMGHGGFRALLGEKGRKQLLNRLFVMLGGKGNTELSRLASEYNLDLNTPEGRQEAMEEYLAHLAEQENIAPDQQKLWQRAWRHIAETLQKAWAKLTGNQAKLGELQVKQLLRDMKTQLREGGQRNGNSESDILASIMQEISSEDTSIPQIAAVLKKIPWKKGTRNLDIGGGKYDLGTDYLKEQGVENVVFDPYNRNESQNQKTITILQGGENFDTATVANVLNVIKEPEYRAMVIRQAARAIKKDGKAYFQIFERNGDGIGGITIIRGKEQWQNNMKTAAYLPEIKQYFGKADPHGNIIEASEPKVEGPVEWIPNGETGEQVLASIGNEIWDKFRKSPKQFLSELKGEYGKLSKQAKEDIGIITEARILPAVLARKFPIVGKLMDIQRERDDKRARAFNDAMDGMDDFAKMRAKDKTAYGYVQDIIFSLDGNKNVKMNNNKFRMDPTGKKIIGLNDKHYDELRVLLYTNLKKSAVSDMAAYDRAVDLYIKMRRSLDQDQMAIIDRVQAIGPQSKIDDLRNQLGRVPFYFPHMRFGDYYVRVVDKKTGDTVYRTHIDAGNKVAAAAAFAAIREKLEKAYDPKQYNFEHGKVMSLPEDVVDKNLSTVDLEAVLMRALDDLKNRGKVTGKEFIHLRSQMLHQIADVLRAHGFGQHMIKRRDIAGYETDDIYRSLMAYKSGLYGWLTKMDASKEFGETIADYVQKNDVRKSPRLFGWLKNYIKDMLRNSDSIDRSTARLKTYFFLKFLGGNIKTATINATQNLVLGLPILSREVGIGNAHALYVRDAMRAILDRLSRGRKNKGPHSKSLTQDEMAFLDDFYLSAVQQSTLFDEYMGQAKGMFSKKVQTFINIMGLPMREVEQFNRLSLALSAYRAAKAGKVKFDKTLKKFGEQKGVGWSEANARRFARDVVDEAHFIYGRGNMPQMLRHSDGGRWMSTAYTFRTFSYNLASWLWRNLVSGENGKEGRIAFLQFAAAQMIVGGLTAVPLYHSFVAAIRALSDGDDPDDWMKKHIGEGDLLDTIMYGLPSQLGVYIGGSLQLELPFAKKLKNDSPWYNQIINALGEEILGVPYGVMMQGSRAVNYAKSGQTGRMWEELLPTAASNILKANRLASEGKRTASGRPIGEEDTRLTTGERIGQYLGYQPVRYTKSYDENASRQAKEGRKKEFKTNLVTEWAQAVRKLEGEALDQEKKRLREKLQDWNRKHPTKEMRIEMKDVVKLAKQRERPLK